MKITTITPAQEARFAEWRDKWIKIGLSTESADFEKAEKAALRAYTLCKLERPEVILRMGSPYGATVGGAMAWLMLRGVLSGVDQQVAQQVWWQVQEEVWRHINNLQVEGPVAQQVWEEVDRKVELRVGQRVWWQVGQQVWQQVERQVLDQVLHQVWWQVVLQGWHGVWSQINQHVLDQVRHQVEQQINQQVEQRAARRASKRGFNNYRSGSFCAAWCAYITFLRDVLGWRDPVLKIFGVEEDIATSCCFALRYEDILAISDRPTEIHLDAEGRLHNENGPSMAYRDGWKLYHVHGVSVPDFVVERPDTIKVEHVESEPNAEVRRVMVNRMGLGRYIRESGLKPIHSDEFGTLYRKEMPGDEPLVVVKVVNSTAEPDGSHKEYFLRVPPDMQRARQAVAWTFAMREEEYKPAVET